MKIWKRYVAALAALFLMLVVPAHAYTTTIFDALVDAESDAEIFFGVIVAAAILVTGFFLGRRWLRSI